MMEPHNLQHQKKWTVGIYFTFNNSTCTWDNDGTAKPWARKKWTVGILLLSTFYFTGIMMNHKPAAPEKVNCWDTFTFNNSTCTNENAQSTEKKLLG
jgi:hypothetical protein